MSNCPYCGASKVPRTFNFNEYSCTMCESDFKLTDSGVKIFQEGSWSSFCKSNLQEMLNKVSGAEVTDLLTKILRPAAQATPNEIDLIIENLTSIAGMLHSAWKLKRLPVKDFTVVMEGIAVFERAAFALKKREKELGLRIRINEDWNDSAKDDSNHIPNDPTADIGEDPVTTIPPQAGTPHDLGVDDINASHEEIPESDVDTESDLDTMMGSSNTDSTDSEAPEDTSEISDDPVDAPVDVDTSREKLLADVEDATETVEDKVKRLSDKINDLKTAITALNASKESDTPIEAPSMDEPVDVSDETPVDDIAVDAPVDDAVDSGIDDTVSDVPSEDTPAEITPDEEDVLNNSYNRMGKTVFESILHEADAKKIGIRTVRSHPGEKGASGGASSYKRKIDSREAEKTSPYQSAIDAMEKEEDIPFTEGPAKQMKGATNSEGPGAVDKAPTNSDFVKEKEMAEAREGFNGFRVGDEVILEGSSDTWTIASIKKNMFTLNRGKTTTTIDFFKESVRHMESRLEWQRNNELVSETANRWKEVEENYKSDETCVTGVCGLGGGNRLGGEKLGSDILASDDVGDTSQFTAKVADKNSIYKYIKDNALHRCQREVAIPRVCEKFNNPYEEMNQIIDDAVLSETNGQTEQIDALYDYKCAPISEHARKDAFSKGWQSINENEVKPEPKKVEPLKGVGYYRTKENDIIDTLGRTAAQRLLGD